MLLLLLFTLVNFCRESESTCVRNQSFPNIRLSSIATAWGPLMFNVLLFFFFFLFVLLVLAVVVFAIFVFINIRMHACIGTIRFNLTYYQHTAHRDSGCARLFCFVLFCCLTTNCLQFLCVCFSVFYKREGSLFIRLLHHLWACLYLFYNSPFFSASSSTTFIWWTYKRLWCACLVLASPILLS